MQAFWAICLFPRQVNGGRIHFRRPKKFFEMISFAFTRAKVIVRERFKPSSIIAPLAVEFMAQEMHYHLSGSVDTTAESFEALGIHRRTKGVCTYLAIVTRAWRRRHSVVS